jgi:uncharacterized RDD family membrane protein YckC
MEPNPYSPPHAPVELAPAADELRLGGRGERLGAVFVDGVIGVFAMLVVVVPLMLLTGWWRSLLEIAMRGQGFPFWVNIVISLSGFALFVLVQGYPLSTTGQTWGKRLLKLRIVDLDGNKPEFWRMLGLRYGIGQVVMLVPFLSIIYALADCLFIFRADKRCVHDHIAGTRVVVAD